jgi:hypothetical protein
LLEYKLYDVKIDGGADESEYLNDWFEKISNSFEGLK